MESDPSNVAITSIFSQPINRRTFLVESAKAAVLLPVAIKKVEQDLYSAAANVLNTPALFRSVHGAISSISEVAPDSENQNYRPMRAMIQEAVKNYEEKNEGNKVSYQKSRQFEPLSKYLGQIRKYPQLFGRVRNPLGLVKELTINMSDELRQAYLFSDTNFSTHMELFPRGSGFYNRLLSEYNMPEGAEQSNEYRNRFQNYASQKAPEYLMKAQSFVESRVTNSDGPVSASDLLEHFLEENHGDLATSIYDVTIFLKAYARQTNPETGVHEATSEQVQWYQSNIRDEYQGLSYQNTEFFESAVNGIGKPYHAWNQVAMLAFFPPEIISMGVLHRQLITFSDQGLAKTRNDLTTMQELPEIEEVLNAFS